MEAFNHDGWKGSLDLKDLLRFSAFFLKIRIEVSIQFHFPARLLFLIFFINIL